MAEKDNVPEADHEAHEPAQSDGGEHPAVDEGHVAHGQTAGDGSAADGDPVYADDEYEDEYEEETEPHTVRAAVKQEGPQALRGEPEADDDPYKWHTGKKRPSGAERDAVEFIDVKKAFGRNAVLNGLNLGIPEGKISMILGPSGTGKSVCIKHMVGLLYPDEGDVLVQGESVPNMTDDELFEMR